MPDQQFEIRPRGRVLAHAARLYELPEPATLEQFTAIAEAWPPLRTWSTVRLRLAGDRSAVEPAP
jgi:hypothetical protein